MRALAFAFGIFVYFNSALQTQHANVTLRTVYQFPNYTVSRFVISDHGSCKDVPADQDIDPQQWVENLAARSNGKILVTLLNTPQVWEIDPTCDSAELLHEFPHCRQLPDTARLEHREIRQWPLS
jgi:hypothetical protein